MSDLSTVIRKNKDYVNFLITIFPFKTVLLEKSNFFFKLSLIIIIIKIVFLNN